MRYIFIDSKDGIDRVGIVENDRLAEFHSGKQDDNKLVGNVYRARVMDVLPGMEAAFVNIGVEKNGYLYVKDALPKDKLYTNKDYKISEILKSGQEIIVQVKKEPFENKGPKVSTHIEIPGRYLVLTPYSNKRNVSRKITNRDEIKRLKFIGKKIMKDDIGMIFRTISEDVDENILEEEYNFLFNIYMNIEGERNFLPCPKLIYREPDLGYQVVRDNYNDETDQIIVNTKKTYDNLKEMAEYYPSDFESKIYLDKDFSILTNYTIQSGISQAFERTVNLKSGGYIVIDETEALTAIDINTGKFIGNKTLSDTILKINLEATEEIARQIRLRDIGGIIIIDFIDMKNERDTLLVLSEFEKHLKRDSIKTNLVGMTKLGLVELTRKKIRRSLFTDFKNICPECKGRGNIIDISYWQMRVYLLK